MPRTLPPETARRLSDLTLQTQADRNLAAAERGALLVVLRREGWSWSELAAACGTFPYAVQKAVKRWTEAQGAPR